MTLDLSGDPPEGDIILDLPVLVENIDSVVIDGKETAAFDNDLGQVVAVSNSLTIKVGLKNRAF